MNSERYSPKFNYGYESRKIPPHELLMKIEELKSIITDQKKEIDLFKKSQSFEKFSVEQFRMVKSKITALEKEKLILTKQNIALENRLKTLEYKSDKLLKIELEKTKLREKLDEQRCEIMKFTKKLSENNDLDINSELEKLQEKINPTVKFRKFIKNKSLLANRFSPFNKNDNARLEFSTKLLANFRKRSPTTLKKPLNRDEKIVIPKILKNSKSDLSVNVESDEPSGFVNVFSSREQQNSVHKLTVQTVGSEKNTNNGITLTQLEADERKLADSLKENPANANKNVTDIQYEVPVLKNSSSIFEVIQCKNGDLDDERIIGSFKIINYCKNSEDAADIKLRGLSSSSTVEKSKENLIKISSKSSSLDNERMMPPSDLVNYQSRENDESKQSIESKIEDNTRTETDEEIEKKRQEIFQAISTKAGKISIQEVLEDKLESDVETEPSIITNQSEITNESEITNDDLNENESLIANQSNITNQIQVPKESETSANINGKSDDSSESSFDGKDTEEYIKSLEDIQKIQPISSYDTISNSVTAESSNYNSNAMNKEVSLPPLLLSSSNFHMQGKPNQFGTSFDKIITGTTNVESVFKVSLQRLEAALKRQENPNKNVPGL